MLKKLLHMAGMFLLFLCLTVSAFAEDAAEAPVRETPELTDEGFLYPGSEPYLVQDEEAGYWAYIDEELSVVIHRRQNPPEEQKLVWYETEIRCTPQDDLTPMLTSKGSSWGHLMKQPKTFIEEHQPVLAFSDDYFTYRWYNKKKQGVIIRDGKILSDTPYSNDVKAFPPLEILALYEDGSMKTFKGKEHTAEEYLDMGVTDTWAFGPILVQNGQPGDRMDDKNYADNNEPRCALGMIEPYHYIVLTVEGRTKQSKGTRLPWMADKMIELGALEAMNLDGGGTVNLIFMGEQLNRHTTKTRTVGSMIGVGLGKYELPEETKKK